ncbi:MAG: helix-turn-helix domain-containing protein [Candidatus Eutrophobiaceae bacterium]
MIERIHLQIIYALAEKGTLTRVAEELCLSQSALSHQIRALEKRLGTRLWERGGKRLRI